MKYDNSNKILPIHTTLQFHPPKASSDNPNSSQIKRLSHSDNTQQSPFTPTLTTPPPTKARQFMPSTNKIPVYAGASSLMTSVLWSWMYWPETLVSKLAEKPNHSAIKQFNNMLENGGISRLFRGFTPSLYALLVSRCATYTGTDFFKLQLQPYFSDAQSPALYFLSGSLAAFTKVLLLQPLETSKGMAQKFSQKGPSQEKALTWFQLGAQSFQRHGLRGLYASTSAAFYKSVIGTGVYMSVRTHVENAIDQYYSPPKTMPDFIFRDGLAGGIAGAVSTLIIHPLQVQKVQRSCGQFIGISTFELVKKTVKQSGYRGVYAGLIVNLLYNSIYQAGYNITYQQLFSSFLNWGQTPTANK